jgi:hypothetical protein
MSKNGAYIGERYVRLLHVPKQEMQEQVRLGTIAIPGNAHRRARVQQQQQHQQHQQQQLQRQQTPHHMPGIPASGLVFNMQQQHQQQRPGGMLPPQMHGGSYSMVEHLQLPPGAVLQQGPSRGTPVMGGYVPMRMQQPGGVPRHIQMVAAPQGPGGGPQMVAVAPMQGQMGPPQLVQVGPGGPVAAVQMGPGGIGQVIGQEQRGMQMAVANAPMG